MIITKLTIENYKQYRGEHTIDIAEHATIGVVGANGVGKTTLFEAIEWCLYKPNSIANKDIRPRGLGGEVRVIVQMATIPGNQVFEVERILKRSSTQAAIYRINEDGSSEPIVQGTREVTDHITTTLIGLSHSAFVATFFTRQKELSFFGNLRPAERRREVGKLLGLETIKQAQALIAEDRSRARADADSLDRQLADRSQDRDIAAEMRETRDVIADRQSVVETTSKSVIDADQTVTIAEATVDEHQSRRDRHAAFSGELRNLETQLQHANDSLLGIGRELELIDTRQRERDALAETASREPALRRNRIELEAKRERFRERERLQQETEHLQTDRARAVTEIRNSISDLDSPEDVSWWHWNEADEASPIEGITRLLSRMEDIDLAAAESQLHQIKTSIDLHEALRQEATRSEKYRERQQELRTTLDALLAHGNPVEQRQLTEKRIDESRQQASRASAAATSRSAQLTREVALIQRLQAQQFDDACPTCGRPFTDDEAGIVISTLERTITEHELDIKRDRSSADEARRTVQRLEGELHTIQQRETEMQQKQARLDSSEEYVRTQDERVADVRNRLERALERLQLRDAPVGSDLAAAEAVVATRRGLHERIQPFRMTLRALTDGQRKIDRNTSRLDAIGTITWDANAYAAVVKDHDAAGRAGSAVEQIDRQLARRPQLQADREQLSQKITALDASISEQQRLRRDVEYVPEVLQEAVTHLKQAREAAQQQRDQLGTAQRHVREAEFALQSLEREQQLLADLARQAELRRRERDELDLMYDEFSAFDRFVAQHQSPMLSDLTSDIVGEMTDGKYDRVIFDEDYGINVFDQTGESFALETFSGGERDAISLAARLALSRMIGSQASNPPGFLVLDEIFGSLDADRRERVLSLLGQHSHEFFRQMFVISHVDDVQQSPVFDFVWQVVLQADGSSTIDTNAITPTT